MSYPRDKETIPGRSTSEMEFKKISAEISESIIQLQTMRDYAHDNHYSETEKQLNDVLKIFNELQAVRDPVKLSKKIDKAKSAILQAKKIHAEREQIFSSLRKSTFQDLFDNVRNFFSGRNKYEVVLEDLEKLRKMETGVKKNTTAALSKFFTSTQLASQETALETSQLQSSKSRPEK